VQSPSPSTNQIYFKKAANSHVVSGCFPCYQIPISLDYSIVVRLSSQRAGALMWRLDRIFLLNGNLDETYLFYEQTMGYKMRCFSFFTGVSFFSFKIIRSGAFHLPFYGQARFEVGAIKSRYYSSGSIKHLIGSKDNSNAIDFSCQKIGGSMTNCCVSCKKYVVIYKGKFYIFHTSKLASLKAFFLAIKMIQRMRFVYFYL